MKIYNKLKNWNNRRKIRNKPKVFGIGANKTGTTSLKIAMRDLGFLVGNQRVAERFIYDWNKRDFKNIIKYCKKAEFFQDVPFSWPYTFIIMDQTFPNSKFILTVRDNADEWYQSLIKFHSKKWGKDGRIPTKEDLMEATYQWKGRPWETNRCIYSSPEEDPYNKEDLVDFYNSYVNSVLDYFKNRPDDLLVLNVANDNAYAKLIDFLGVTSEIKSFPWKKKSN